VLGPLLTDEGPGDRDAVGLIGDHDSCAQIEQDAKPAEGGDQGKREADHSCIDADVGARPMQTPAKRSPSFSRYSRLVPLLGSFMA
jgi:hypothetical protein